MSTTADHPESLAPDQRPSRVRHLVLAGLLVITAVNYVQRNSLGLAATTVQASLPVPGWLQERFGVETEQDLRGLQGILLDQANGAFFLAYTFLQVPSGWFARWLGSRLTLPLYAVGWSLALVGCALAGDFVGLYLGRVFMGIFQAGIFPCATLILAAWYPSTQRGLATALLNSFMLIGGAAAAWITGDLLGLMDWRTLFLAYAAPGFVWALWFVWWFRNRPEEHPSVNQAEIAVIREGGPPPKPQAATATWAIYLSLPLVLLCTQQAFRASANRLFDTRLPTYYEERLLAGEEASQVTETDRKEAKGVATKLASLPQWAGVVGGLIGGTLSDVILRRTGSRRLARRGVALGSLAGSILLYVLALMIPNLYLSALVLSLGMFLFSFSSPCSYALCIDISGPYLATAFGLMNMLGNLGAWLFVSSITGLVVLGGWELLFTVWIGLHVVALVCWLFLDPEVTIGELTPAKGVSP